MAHDVFISYSSLDKPTADAVCATLEARRVRCWIAPRDILPGQEYAAALVDAIGASRLFVLVLSTHSNGSPQVRREVERAVSKGLPILPFRIDDVALSKSMEYFVSSQHWLDALTPPLEKHLQTLAGAVEALITPGEGRAPSGASPAPAGRPDLPTQRTRASPTFEGQRIGRYLLQELLGSGGSGRVYRARDTHLGRPVCVKVFYPFDEAAFSRVATTVAGGVRAVAGLDHDNIVRIFDLGRFAPDGVTHFYVVMELVEGQPLDRWSAGLPDDAAALARRLRLAASLTDALRAAHAARYVADGGLEQTGVLHGDLKPANVIVRPNDAPLLLDFMLVDVQRLLRPGGAPSPGQAITANFGTPGFMPPEQEHEGIVTVRSDVFGLGMTLCHLFAPRAQQPLLALLRPADGAPWPPSLRHLLRAMLEPDPAARPPDLGQVAAELARAAAELGTYLPEPPAAGLLPPSTPGRPEAPALEALPADAATQGVPADTLLNGRYAIVGPLAPGPAGPRYLVEDQLLLRRLCLEQRRPEPSGAAAAAQLSAATAALVRLAHPGLPRSFDAFVEHGREYVVLEQVDGPDLETLLAERPGGLDEPMVLGWIDQVLDALAGCHALTPPLVHGAIRPASVRIRRSDRRAVLVDFAPAAPADGSNRPAGRAPAPGYLAPEQAGGSFETCSDVYALGATLYHLLTGRAPPPALALARFEALLAPPRTLNPSISPGVEQVILHAMQLLPHQRYWTADELRRALQTAPAPAGPPPAGTRPPTYAEGDTQPSSPAEAVAVLPPPSPITPPGPPATSTPLPPTPPPAPPARAARPQLGPGIALGPYRLAERIWSSGMADVWRAAQAVLERDVALKVLSPQQADDPMFRARFRQEALTLAHLAHPNILPVFDYGEQHGLTYMASPLIAGRTLARALEQRGPWLLAEALAVLRPLASALDYVHAAGIVHRDVKPANVLLSDTGWVVLFDFGVAHQPSGGLTDPGTIIGTLEYLAPELIDGQPAAPSNDLYSLAITAYQLLVGRVPFPGSTMPELLQAHRSESPPDPRELNPGLPEAAAWVLRRMLAKDPHARPRTATQLVEALAAAEPGASRSAAGPAPPSPGDQAFAAPPASGAAPPLEAPTAPAAGAQVGATTLTAAAPEPPAGRPVAERGGIFSGLGKFFSGRGDRAADSSPPPPTPDPAPPGPLDRVHFAVTSPSTVEPGSLFLLDVWAHLEQQRAEVIQRVQAVYRGREFQHRSQGPLPLARDTLLEVRLSIEGLAVDPPEAPLLWSGEIANSTFRVGVPQNFADGPRSGQASIHLGSSGARLAMVYFELEVKAAGRGPASPEPVPLPVREALHRKAFVSYARPDFDRVLLCVQGMQQALPSLEVFLDVLSLRAGQYWEQELWKAIPANDVFYLFWSANARQSAWVEKEWRCALTTRGLDFIAPVPLVSPEEAPPPPELAPKHFNHWTVRFRGE